MNLLIKLKVIHIILVLLLDLEKLLRQAGIDVLTIHAILKEEFGDHVSWMYDDIYNFIYYLEGSGLEKREIDAEDRFNDIVVYDNTYKTNCFKMLFGIFTGVNNYGYIILTDDDHAMANAYSKVLQPLGTKHCLYQWHLMKNVMKNLSAKLNMNWSAFIRDFYKCLEEIVVSSFFLNEIYLKHLIY
ncbi:9243_t:CDS:2 [Gigaspora margarita]|uniref:9243_t:CDS:1 n=1 Tax=Gigaspora margarita TaxID=4874 RepID=A0ABN7UNM3_GIGMA|nr:9243_t:CDS:2 [Gigaspora margarita]